jgi:hypothetical protein
MIETQDRRYSLTNGDVQRIRQHLATCRFLHLKRAALEWGLTVSRRTGSRAVHHRPI